MKQKVLLCIFGIGFFAMLMTGVIEAKVSKQPSLKPHRYNLSICAIFRDEASFLKEWIEYHRLIGVDHFYLYNNNSSDSFRDELKDYVYEGLVSIIDWSGLNVEGEGREFIWALSTQVSAYENAIKLRAFNESKWLVFVDVDEFLVPTYANSITELLEIYKDKPGITISSLCFNASERDHRGNLLIESVLIANPPPKNQYKEVSKTIFKPRQCAGFTWPPYKCKFKENQKEVKLSQHELRINRYVNRVRGSAHVGNIKKTLNIDHRFLSEKDTLDLLCDGYQIIDHERSIYRFIPSLLQKMGYVSINPKEE